MVTSEDARRLLWCESRPNQGGRSVIVECDANGADHDRSPAGSNVRSRVHEYGGGAWTAQGPDIWYVNDIDRRIYHQRGSAPPRPITPTATLNYADLEISSCGKRLLAVQETPAANGAEPVDRLVSITTDAASDDATIDIIAEGDDFYASATLSNDQRQIAWLSWNHPNMPWDGTTLWVAERHPSGSIGTPQAIAGSAQESVFQPQWGGDGRLYFVSDRSGWWNLYRWDGRQTQALLPMEAEFGLPQWVFGMSCYAISDDGRLLCAFSRAGRWQLGLLQPDSGEWRELDLPYSEFSDIHITGQFASLLVAAATLPPTIITLDLSRIDPADAPSDGSHDIDAVTVVRSSTRDLPPLDLLSKPQAISYPGSRGETAHALYYPPTNPDFQAPTDERPPLLVRSHGGPTAATSTALNLSTQFWTSRGFAVLDVNYGGSTGYGRQYRQRLDGRWGITDVDDCVCGADYLIEQGLADPKRCAICGSSAGGYTTLAALTFSDRFSAGASLYGISDLEALVADTHKFESRYLDRLIGPYPQQREIYRQRSPIHHLDQLSCPIIFFQGLQDKVVPPSQAEAMVAALRQRGLPVAYLSFAEEQHGFRAAATIKTALQAELYFYGRLFGFEPADDLPTIAIDNPPTA